MAASSWHPSADMIRALLAEHGFRESPFNDLGPDYICKLGGYAFFRDHPDGRLQMLYVFSWSNFRLHEQDPEQYPTPCNLAVRVHVDVRGSETDAWRHAPYGPHYSLGFNGPDDWHSACEQFASVIMPILDEPASDEED